MRLQEGDTLGAYQIVGEVGRGGMATVYRAHHTRLEREVALKFMHEAFIQDEGFRERFKREAQIIARLDHSNIVPIYDFDEYQNIPYLVMKYIPGMTLKRKAIKAGLTLRDTYELLRDIADGLDYAHREGILHRDMKPSNILVDDRNRPYITDFGLARIASAGSSTISHDMMLGTPFYISPEQAQGERNLTAQTDIYSLGVILYELITGEVPFHADTPYAIVHGHIYQHPKMPSQINPDLNGDVDDVIERALAKKPQERFPTASALMQAFLEALDSVGPAPSPLDHKQPVPETLAVPVPSAGFGPVPADLPGKSKSSDPSDTSAEFDDLGDDFMAERRSSAPIITNPRRSNTPAPARKSGDINWTELGQTIRSGAESLAEMIEERIDSELLQRKGITYNEQEELLRRRALKKIKERRAFVQHLTTYLLVNGLLLAIWLLTGAGFFWPFFPIFFWGMGLFFQGYDYYSKYGPGSDRHQEQIQREIDIERARLTGGSSNEKETQSAARLRLPDSHVVVRLNDEGELTDSFVEEQQERQSRG